LTVLIEHFDLDVRGDRQLPLFEPRYNIAPTQEILVVRNDPADGRRRADLMRWGLIPSWGAGPKAGSGPPMINARSETLTEKPMFRSAVRRRRCLIPVDGFYEWQQLSGGGRGKKQPYFIHRPDDGPFAFAGLWESWRQSEPSTNPSLQGRGIEGDGVPLTIESCTIVTTEANATLRELHERMPVVLAPCDYAMWLDSNVEDAAALKHLLAPCGEEELVAEPVGTHVNKVANDDPRCVEIQRTLF
jgi:putative SOS response-associated peptidase YedK